MIALGAAELDQGWEGILRIEETARNCSPLLSTATAAADYTSLTALL